MSIEHSPARSRKSGRIMDDYMSLPDLAAELNCHPRTIGRYERLPDGLPVTMIAGRKHYNVAKARAFIERRTRQPNPVRRGAA